MAKKRVTSEDGQSICSLVAGVFWGCTRYEEIGEEQHVWTRMYTLDEQESAASALKAFEQERMMGGPDVPARDRA